MLSTYTCIVGAPDWKSSSIGMWNDIGSILIHGILPKKLDSDMLSRLLPLGRTWMYFKARNITQSIIFIAEIGYVTVQ